MKRATPTASLLMAVCASSVQAQQMNRCQDASGRSVYVDRECALYGLRHIGSVQDRVTVAPAPNSKQEEDSSSPSTAQQAMQACRADVGRNPKVFDVLDFDVFSNQKWDRLHESHARDIVVTWPDGHADPDGNTWTLQERGYRA